MLYYRRGQGKPTTNRAAAVKRTKGNTMELVKIMKRNIYKDGWHTATETFSFYVENGRLIKGLRYGDPFGPKLIYPYKWSKRLNCYDNVSGITARYGCWKNVTWR